MTKQTEITPEQLQQLKATHGKLWQVRFNPQTIVEGPATIPNRDYDEDYPTLDFVFKKTGFDVLAAAASMAAERPIQSIKLQMESALVWGDKDALFDDKDVTVFATVSQDFQKINKVLTTQLKKT